MPDTTPLLQPTGLSPSLAGVFVDELDDTQNQMSKAVQDGYPVSAADRIILQPMRAKWKLLESSPELQERYAKYLKSYDRDGGAWAFEQALQPSAGAYQPTTKPAPEAKVPEAQRMLYESAVHERDILLNKGSKIDADGQKRLALAEDTIGQFEAANAPKQNPAPLNQPQPLRPSLPPLTVKDLAGSNAQTPEEADRYSHSWSLLPFSGGAVEDRNNDPAWRSKNVLVPASAQGQPPPQLQPSAAAGGMGNAPEIPDLTGNPQAIAALPYGSTYSENGHVYRTTHATPLSATSGGIYISGSPELSNETREQAEASWNARYALKPSTPAGATSTPPDDSLVSVINPNGKRVKIKKSQLDDALKSGYKLP